MAEFQYQKGRFKQAEFAAWVGIIGNFVLALIKLIIGWVGNSRALVADAIHSASDVIGSLAVLVGLRAAKRPPDRDHPYGHGKAESIAAIIVAVILFIVGGQMAYSSLGILFQPVESPGAIAIYAALFSIVVKEVMFQYKHRLGKKLRSDALIINAWEHRSDVYSSLAALLGIGGAVLGGYLQVPWMIYLDPAAGVVVSLLIMRMAWKLGKESIHNTLDHVLHEEDARELKDTVSRVPGVIQIDELYAREHGHYVIVDVKIAVDPQLTVEQGHAIAKEVKDTLLAEHRHVYNALVHVNPYEQEAPSHR